MQWWLFFLANLTTDRQTNSPFYSSHLLKAKLKPNISGSNVGITFIFFPLLISSPSGTTKVLWKRRLLWHFWVSPDWLGRRCSSRPTKLSSEDTRKGKTGPPSCHGRCYRELAVCYSYLLQKTSSGSGMLGQGGRVTRTFQKVQIHLKNV